MKASSSRKLVAEFVGTAVLVAAVVGSGVMAERLSSGNFGLALLDRNSRRLDLKP